MVTTIKKIDIKINLLDLENILGLRDKKKITKTLDSLFKETLKILTLKKEIKKKNVLKIKKKEPR
jgi:hypothetical protein